MIPLNWFIIYIIVFTCIMFFPLVMQFAIRQRCSGRLLCAIVGTEKPLDFKLLKTKTGQGEQGEFVEDGNDKWLIVTKQVKLVKYPILFPKAFQMFQQIVGCSLYMRGRAEPLDWEDPPKGLLSSKELPAILDPHWLVALVRGVEEGNTLRPDKRARMMALLAVAASMICMILIFVVLYKLGTMQTIINTLPEALKLVR